MEKSIENKLTLRYFSPNNLLNSFNNNNNMNKNKRNNTNNKIPVNKSPNLTSASNTNSNIGKLPIIKSKISMNKTSQK